MAATRAFKKSLFKKLIALIIIANFILASGPISVYSSSGFISHSIRIPSGLKTDNPERNHLIDDLNADLHARAKAIIANMPANGTTSFFKYDAKKGGYAVTRINKKELEKLFARDEIGLIEDENNPGQYIWANKIDGGVVTKNGDLFISGRITYPVMEDVPLGQINYPLYAKVIPLAYSFFKTYLGKGKYSWISDILAKAKVLVVAPGSLGERHFSADKTSKTIKIESDFMDYILDAGYKRVGMGLFAEAAIALSNKETEPEKAQEIVNKIARMSLTGRNRLENAIYLFNLKKEIAQKERRLTPQERQLFLIDTMERNRSFNGRRAARLLRQTYGLYGRIIPEEAEADLRAIKKAHPQEIAVDPYVPKEEDAAAKYVDRTNSFRVDGRFMADTDLIKGRRIVWDFEVDAQDAFLFGGKVAYTGMMQWIPHIITLPMFATAGICFREDLINYNNYGPEFHKIAKELEDGVGALEKEYGKNSKDPEHARRVSLLIRDCAARLQGKLDWGVAKISPELVKELKEALKSLAENTGTSVFQLILAIRSSAIGEDSESASFAGRQDTSLFVTPLSEELSKLKLKPEDFGYTWEDLSRSVFPWYDILNKARAKIGDRAVTDEMLDVFIKEWLANQRSLFNVRSIEYRIEKGIPVFTDQVEMSSVFQLQANTEFGYVAMGVNKATGFPEMQFEIIEGQTNPLVDGSGTGDLVFVDYVGHLRAIQVPESRQALHVPNIFGTAGEEAGEIKKGGVISLKFPEHLKGMPAITDVALLGIMGKADGELTGRFGMFSDIEGGLIIRRDKKGNIVYEEDPFEPDGIAKDHVGNPRMSVFKFQTQIRPETEKNFKNPDVVEQHWMEVAEEDYRRAIQEGKVLYATGQAHTQGAVKGEVFIVEKDHPETWFKVAKKIMVTLQSA